MGYANTIPYQQILLRTAQKVNFTVIDAVASSPEIASFTIPNFKNPISLAYLDIIIGYVGNDNVAVNYLTSGGTFGLLNVAETLYYSGGNVPAGSCYTLASTYQPHYVIMPGTNNLAPYIVPGATQKIRFNDIDCSVDHLYLGEMSGELRLYFAV